MDKKEVVKIRKHSNYDWEWFESKAPFKKIMAEECDLQIVKKIHYSYVICGNIISDNKYFIKVDYQVFKNNFHKIKRRLLNTNICRKNIDVKEFVENIKCNKSDLCDLIMTACIKNASGIFQWKFE